MKKNEIIAIKKNRLNKLKRNGKNLDSCGVTRKLERELRNLSK